MCISYFPPNSFFRPLQRIVSNFNGEDGADKQSLFPVYSTSNINPNIGEELQTPLSSQRSSPTPPPLFCCFWCQQSFFSQLLPTTPNPTTPNPKPPPPDHQPNRPIVDLFMTRLVVPRLLKSLLAAWRTNKQRRHPQEVSSSTSQLLFLQHSGRFHQSGVCILQADDSADLQPDAKQICP